MVTKPSLDELQMMTSSPRNDLQCWSKFSNFLVHWSIRMIRAKNYETVSKFVKVMPRILWPHFFPGHGVYTDYSIALLTTTYDEGGGRIKEWSKLMTCICYNESRFKRLHGSTQASDWSYDGCVSSRVDRVNTAVRRRCWLSKHARAQCECSAYTQTKIKRIKYFKNRSRLRKRTDRWAWT